MVSPSDSLSLDWRLCQAMLLVNALWDFLSTLCIWHSFCVKDVQDLLVLSQVPLSAVQVDAPLIVTTAATSSSTTLDPAAHEQSLDHTLILNHHENDDPNNNTNIMHDMNNNNKMHMNQYQYRHTNAIDIRYLFNPTAGKDTHTEEMVRQLGWLNTLSLYIAQMHTALWATKSDALNHAACILMGWWILTMGLIRFIACMDRTYLVMAALSYGVEGLFFLSESLKSTMAPKKSCLVSVLSMVCLLLCVIKIPHAS